MVPATVGVAALVLGGCGAGQITQTDTQVAAVNGAVFNVGPIAIRDAQLAYPDSPGGAYRPGDDAKVVTTIINGGRQDDRLMSVKSPYFNGSRVGGHTAIPGNTAVRSGTDPDDEQRAAATQPSARPAPQQPVDSVQITLTGLNRTVLRSGMTVPVTFTFAKAGSHTAQLPIGAAYDPPSQE